MAFPDTPPQSEVGLQARQRSIEMGYQLTSIYSLSKDDVHSYFVFYVGHRFEDSVSQWIDKNFAAIAKGLGPKAAIVRGLSEEFDKQVMTAYQGQIKTVILKKGWYKNIHFGQSVNSLLSDYDTIVGMSHSLFPLLFVTDRHPLREPSQERDQVFYLIPLGQIDSEREVREIIETILGCVQVAKFDLLDKLLARKFGKSPLNLVKAINQSAELKPNVMGLGVNLNGLIDLFVKEREK
jgi:diphthamide synthase (EF-2-diphthine--ammonia ligase)